MKTGDLDKKILTLEKKILKWEYDLNINADLNGCESLSEWEASIYGMENNLKVLKLQQELSKDKAFKKIGYPVLATIIATVSLGLLSFFLDISITQFFQNF